ncbi:MAG TPA: tetratricopeptide repeat protein [Oligoflexus sp.]|uniref:tetratricopeptide repeat protein n=1 Tax=Oligoflexus sp. TaxID=1971216 RepID=UPI002D7FD57C|nr:tetratricopeptide repeat protein [Oligoflexus sp.]HET9236690.1 tetratricopeptide repeat protein [Oligoflexus sp.]
MKKSTLPNFIPQMLGFLFLLSLFVGVLLSLKNPEFQPFEPDHVQAQLPQKSKAHPMTLAPEPERPLVSHPASAPGKADELYQKAVIAARGHADDETARRLLQEALRENPNHIQAADELYASYEARKDWEGALATFQKLESENNAGTSAGLDYGLGRIYLELGHPDQARVRLEEALDSDADNPLIREQLALAYNSMGEREWARREWQRLAQDESAGRASLNAKIKLAEDLFAEGRWAEAEVYAKDVLKQDPNNRLGTLLSQH